MILGDIMFLKQKILILGMARSGYEAAKVLIERECDVVLNDSKSEDKMNKDQVEELRNLGVRLIFGSHPDDLLDDSFDFLIKNPGVPIDHIYVEKARELGIEVINEVEMAYRLLPEDVTLIGITGTNGKTTTTTLTYEILKEAFGDRVHLAGNIGFPLCSFLKKLKKDDIIVMEVSCQQGENLKEFRPHIALFTNLTEAHIDFMKTYEHYKMVKSKMFYNQKEEDVAILNIENEDVLEVTKNILSTTKYFSSKNEVNGCYIKEDAIYYYGEKVLNTADVFIKGRHNLENVMASIMISKEFGVSDDVILSVISTFKGVEHRLEYVDTVDGVKYYNDTEATNIKCTQIALSSFKEPQILILGGLERGQNFEELTPYIGGVKAIVGIGQCRNRVLEYGTSIDKPTYIFETLKEAFPKCVELASSGEVVLLSPASASWDQYKECEERGGEFKEYVSMLNK